MTTKDDNKKHKNATKNDTTPYTILTLTPQWQKNTQRRRTYAKQDNAHKHAHKNQNFKQETKIKMWQQQKQTTNFQIFKYWPIDEQTLTRYRLSRWSKQNPNLNQCYRLGEHEKATDMDAWW